MLRRQTHYVDTDDALIASRKGLRGGGAEPSISVVVPAGEVIGAAVGVIGSIRVLTVRVDRVSVAGNSASGRVDADLLGSWGSNTRGIRSAKVVHKDRVTPVRLNGGITVEHALNNVDQHKKMYLQTKTNVSSNKYIPRCGWTLRLRCYRRQWP